VICMHPPVQLADNLAARETLAVVSVLGAKVRVIRQVQFYFRARVPRSCMLTLITCRGLNCRFAASMQNREA
jgi:hypothetical protein